MSSSEEKKNRSSDKNREQNKCSDESAGARRWTREEMEGAEPFPMPEIDEDEVEENDDHEQSRKSQQRKSR